MGKRVSLTLENGRVIYFASKYARNQYTLKLKRAKHRLETGKTNHSFVDNMGEESGRTAHDKKYRRERLKAFSNNPRVDSMRLDAEGERFDESREARRPLRDYVPHGSNQERRIERGLGLTPSMDGQVAEHDANRRAYRSWVQSVQDGTHKAGIDKRIARFERMNPKP